MINALLPLIGKVIDKILPDPGLQNEAKIKMMELAQKGELQILDKEAELLLQQIELNKIEAQSSSLFKSGWRPFIGWLCGIGLFYQFIINPILPWIINLVKPGVPPLPSLDMGTLTTIMFGILGLGGLRTFERVKGKIPRGQ